MNLCNFIKKLKEIHVDHGDLEVWINLNDEGTLLSSFDWNPEILYIPRSETDVTDIIIELTKTDKTDFKQEELKLIATIG